MKLTKEQIMLRCDELCREIEYYLKLPNGVGRDAADRLQGELFGLQWVIDHFETGYSGNE